MAKKTKEQITSDAIKTQRNELVLSAKPGDGGLVRDEDGKTFAQVYQSENVDGDAARLAACWNAFMGVPTDKIATVQVGVSA